MKDTKRQVLFDTLRAAARGESLLSPEVIAKVVDQSGGVTTPALKVSASEIARTDREQEVLIGVARGGDCGGHTTRLAVRRALRDTALRLHFQGSEAKFLAPFI